MISDGDKETSDVQSTTTDTGSLPPPVRVADTTPVRPPPPPSAVVKDSSPKTRPIKQHANKTTRKEREVEVLYS